MSEKKHTHTPHDPMLDAYLSARIAYLNESGERPNELAMQAAVRAVWPHATRDINPAAVPVMVEALKAVLQSANESYEQEELALWSDDIGRLHKACGEALQLAGVTP